MKARDKNHFKEAWMSYIHQLALLYAEAGASSEWNGERTKLAGLVDEAANRAFPEIQAEGKIPPPGGRNDGNR